MSISRIISRIDAITAAIESGRVLRQPTWTVGPYQTACAADGACYAVIDITGDVVLTSADSRRIAQLATLRVAEDRRRDADYLDRAERRSIDVRAVDRSRILTREDT